MFFINSSQTTKTGTISLTDNEDGDDKFKIEVTNVDKINDQSALQKAYVYDYQPGIVLPLQMGDGSYEVKMYRQVSGNKYAVYQGFKYQLRLTDPNIPFLSPNVYVSYDGSLSAIACGETIDATADFVKNLLSYDYAEAKAVQNKEITVYIPDIKEIIATKKGTCSDYSSLFAALLRTRGIPCKLIFGYYNVGCHAWNEVFVNGIYRRYDLTFADAGRTDSLVASDTNYLKKREY